MYFSSCHRVQILDWSPEFCKSADFIGQNEKKSKNKHPIKLRFLIWKLQGANPEKKLIPENPGFGSYPNFLRLMLFHIELENICKVYHYWNEYFVWNGEHSSRKRFLLSGCYGHNSSTSTKQLLLLELSVRHETSPYARRWWLPLQPTNASNAR